MAGNDGNPYTPLVVDGQFGPQSTRALQWKLNQDGGYGLAVDGSFGPLTSRALEWHIALDGDSDLVPGCHVTFDCTTLQNWCGATGFQPAVTGVWDYNTSRACQLSLNSTRF